jgi:hypothetical protein
MNACDLGYEILKNSPTTMIALIVAYVAVQQWRVSRAKLKLDLFDRRYAIFMEVWKILSEVVHKGTRETNLGLFTPFNNLIPQAKFLFGEEIGQYLETLTTKWTRLHGIEGMQKQSTYAQEKYELTGWFKEQADNEVKRRFAPYLTFEKWK